MHDYTVAIVVWLLGLIGFCLKPYLDRWLHFRAHRTAKNACRSVESGYVDNGQTVMDRKNMDTQAIVADGGTGPGMDGPRPQGAKDHIHSHRHAGHRTTGRHPERERGKGAGAGQDGVDSKDT